MKTISTILSLLVANAIAAPAADQLRHQKRLAQEIIPYSVASTYYVSTGAIQYDVHEGHIFKDGVGSDESTLLTFVIPDLYLDHTCAFNVIFDGMTDYASGSRQFDIFTSLKPALSNATTWPPGNQRDNYYGRMMVDTIPGSAVFVDGITATASSFPCPIGTWGAELVGVGDVDSIFWGSASTGAQLIISS